MFTVSFMENGRYVNRALKETEGSWSKLAKMLKACAAYSSDGLASFDTDTTRHNVWTHPECTGGLEATIDSQSF